MHYSIIIQGKPSNGSFTWDNPYRFKNPYITMIKVLLSEASFHEYGIYILKASEQPSKLNSE